MWIAILLVICTTTAYAVLGLVTAAVVESRHEDCKKRYCHIDCWRAKHVFPMWPIFVVVGIVLGIAKICLGSKVVMYPYTATRRLLDKKHIPKAKVVNK